MAGTIHPRPNAKKAYILGPIKALPRYYLLIFNFIFQDRGFDTPLLNKTLFRKIRYFLGGRVRLLLSGGAPLSPDTHSLTRTCLCVPVMQGYGLTETTACATVTS